MIPSPSQYTSLEFVLRQYLCDPGIESDHEHYMTLSRGKRDTPVFFRGNLARNVMSCECGMISTKGWVGLECQVGLTHVCQIPFVGRPSIGDRRTLGLITAHKPNIVIPKWKRSHLVTPLERDLFLNVPSVLLLLHAIAQ